MLVHIVIVATPDRSGPDLTRMGKLEEIPDDLARLMLDNGTARLPSDEELAAYEQSREVAAKADEATADGGDLTKLTKADLQKLAEDKGVEVPPHATKADIAQAIKEHADATPLPDDAGAEDTEHPE